MSMERRPLVRQVGARRLKTGGRTVHTGRVGEVEVVIAQLGVGPAVARTTTDWALDRFSVDHVVVTGIAGGLHPDLAVGAVVTPESILDLESGRRYHAWPLGKTAAEGTIATTDHLIVDERQLDLLQAAGVLALEMESAAVAAACEAASVPWTAIRAIGDRPDQNLTDSAMLSLLRPDGTTHLAAALRLVAADPGRIGAMARLARDSSMAASVAAQAVLSAIRA
jgi:adenosylhomocysteine nucleosidase